ncbi:MAG: hypothetical protein QM718_04850 [Steroidobacteraceae bacterium]
MSTMSRDELRNLMREVGIRDQVAPDVLLMALAMHVVRLQQRVSALEASNPARQSFVQRLHTKVARALAP